jgi:hypothetical protein
MFSEPIVVANEPLIPDGDSRFLFFEPLLLSSRSLLSNGPAVGHFCPMAHTPVSEPLKLDIKVTLARKFIVHFSPFFGIIQ